MAEKFLKGQRYISETEPELGLGLVKEVIGRDIIMHFPAAEENRRYRQNNAPLKRSFFETGDSISDGSGKKLSITHVEEKGGLFIYHCGDYVVREQELSGSNSYNSIQEQLDHGQFGYIKDFFLRYETLKIRHELLSNPCRGLIGPRIELMEHQIHIADVTSANQAPRALLADEVGLGKTIEAGLIFHKFYSTERISRVLVITPRSLVNQWLVEMYRKFAHMFTIISQETLKEDRHPENENPFSSVNTVISPIDLFTESSHALNQAVESKWDLIITDEAHHLSFEKGKPSKEYSAVERLSGSSSGLLLLTATPMQLGEEGHFSRLRLLDPYRFKNFELYKQETRQYKDLAKLADKIFSPQTPTKEIIQDLTRLFPKDDILRILAQTRIENKADSSEKLVQSLIDRHGTGRMVFRNQSKSIKGFPGKKLNEVNLIPLESFKLLYKKLNDQISWSTSVLKFDPVSLTPADFKTSHEDAVAIINKLWKQDPRIIWLKEFLLKLQKGEKVLLICDNAIKVSALMKVLPSMLKFPFTVFHEHLPLNIRDKNAADFSREDGVRLLITSEIGSEGRNFQLADHLVLFDIPINPGTLEQRIGRLHRIGRKTTVNIHVPYIKGTIGELLFKWHHTGLNSFLSPVLSAEHVYRSLAEKLEETADLIFRDKLKKKDLEHVIRRVSKETGVLVKKFDEIIESGRDKLLELNSFQAVNAKKLIEQIKMIESANDLEQYLERVFETYGINFIPTVEKRGFLISSGPETVIEALPGLPEEGLAATLSRSQALVREDLAFISWEHPLVTGAMDMILSGSGSVCISEWKPAPEAGILLNLVYILEPILSGNFDIFDFMPPTPIRILVDHNGNFRSDLEESLNNNQLRQGSLTWPRDLGIFRKKFLPDLLNRANSRSQEISSEIKNSLLKSADLKLAQEHEYYSYLGSQKHANSELCKNKAASIKKIKKEVEKRIYNAGTRLDSACIILMIPPST